MDTSTETARVRAFDRLKGLPEVFDLKEVCDKFGVSDGSARVMTQRWKAAGMVKPVGPKTGLYYNLIADPKAPDRYKGAAVRRAIKSAVLIGASAINKGEWTTQTSQGVIEVAALKTRELRSHPQITGVQLVERPKQWYEIAAPFILTKGELIPRLAPEAAVADAWIFGGEVWQPSPDDIDVESIANWQNKLMKALLAFGMDEAEAERRIGEIDKYGSGQRP